MQEEISLREIIETIWNGKWIIAVTTITAMLITGLYGYFMLKPTYEAISTIRIGSGSAEQIEGLQPYLNSYADSVKTDVAINRLIEKLKLDKRVYSINSMRNSLNVEVVNNTNVLKIRAEGDDPSRITSITNLLAFELGARIEISGRSQKIVESKKRMSILEDLIVINKIELEETTKLLKEMPEKLVTKEAVANKPYIQSILEQSTDISNLDLGVLQVESEEINPVYLNLKERMAVKTIEMSINLSEMKNMETIISENQLQIEQLELQMDEVKLSALKSERLLSEFSAVFISPAIKPQDPIGPNNVFNVLVAAVIGAIISILSTFVIQYWRNTSEPKSVKSEATRSN